jgi:hypothetical protein
MVDDHKSGAVAPTLVTAEPVHGSHANPRRSGQFEDTRPCSLPEKRAYVALIELYRTFLFDDGPLLETIKDQGGSMSSTTLARIAQSYSVSRTIPAGPEDNSGQNLELFAEVVTQLSRSWPGDFQQRAKACREAAVKLSREFVREDRTRSRAFSGPHSAVTKLIWFLRPHGWTVYDKLAADAVLRSGGSTEERQARFYLVVQEPLRDAAQRSQGTLGHLDARLHPERLFDKLLLCTSLSKTPEKFGILEQKNRHFLRLLPPSLARRVHDVALEAGEQMRTLRMPKEERREESLQELSKRGLFARSAARD